MIILGPSLTGLRGTQLTGSIIYTLVSGLMDDQHTSIFYEFVNQSVCLYICGDVYDYVLLAFIYDGNLLWKSIAIFVNLMRFIIVYCL
jgi:hypothetical protein